MSLHLRWTLLREALVTLRNRAGMNPPRYSTKPAKADSTIYFGNLYASFVGFNGRASQYGRRLPSGLTLSAERVIASHLR